VAKVNSDKAYDYIRKKILDGEFPPGSSLMTEQLSTEIGVSRTPVRDALRQLESDGLVCIRPRLGASVKQVDMKELRELCELRLALEGHTAYLAALNRNEAELAEIRVAAEAMRRLVEAIAAARKEEALVTELAREDVRFHIAIMNAAKNDVMKKEILRLHLINRVVAGTGSPIRNDADLSTKAERDARRQQVLASHTQILDAITRRNGPAAKKAMEEHIQELIEHSLRSFAQNESTRPARKLTADELLYSA
jgi:DNA-binding GntR family transcriptional regulator